MSEIIEEIPESLGAVEPGARQAWLAEKLAAHSFVLLVFYRGFW